MYTDLVVKFKYSNRAVRSRLSNRTVKSRCNNRYSIAVALLKTNIIKRRAIKIGEREKRVDDLFLLS